MVAGKPSSQTAVEAAHESRHRMANEEDHLMVGGDMAQSRRVFVKHEMVTIRQRPQRFYDRGSSSLANVQEVYGDTADRLGSL